MKKETKWLLTLICILLIVPSIAFWKKDSIIKKYEVNNYLIMERFYLKEKFYSIIIKDDDNKVKIPLYYHHNRNYGREIISINKKNNCYFIKTKSLNRQLCLKDNYFEIEKPTLLSAKYLKRENIEINANITNKILWWDYRNLNIIDKNKTRKIKLPKDDYTFKNAYLKNDVFIYLPVDINTIETINLIDVNNPKIKIIEMPYILSSNIRFLGDKDDEIYLLDEDALRGYTFNINNKEMKIIKDLIPIYNNGWTRYTPAEIMKNNIYFNKVDKKIFKDDVFKTSVINDSKYGSCFLYKDSIYQKMPNTDYPVLRYSGRDIRQLECVDGVIYFVQGMRFRKIEKNHLITIAKNEELFYNKNKIIFIEK